MPETGFLETEPRTSNDSEPQLETNAKVTLVERWVLYKWQTDGDGGTRKTSAEWQSVIGVLAHLQIGRAYAMQDDTIKARSTYNDFLTLWKDANPDIPILKQAKAEYAKL